MSTRSAKRQKLSTEEPPQPSTPIGFLQKIKNVILPQSSQRKSPRTLITYGSSSKRKAVSRGTVSVADLADTENCATESQDGDGAVFADSAYQSMTTQEEQSDDGISELASKRSKRRKSLVNDSLSQPAINEGSDIDTVQETLGKRKRLKKANVDDAVTLGDMHVGQLPTERHSSEDDIQVAATIGGTPSKTKSRNITNMESLPNESLQLGQMQKKMDASEEPHRSTEHRIEERGPSHESELHDTIVVRDNPEQGSSDGDVQEAPVRSSGRQRKPTRQLLEIQMAKKAISTPTKSPGRRRGRPPKNPPVPSRPPDTDTQMQFKGIPCKPGLRAATLDREDELALSGKTMSVIQQPPSPQTRKGRPPTKIVPSTTTTTELNLEEDQNTNYHLKNLMSVMDEENMEQLFVLLQTRILDGLTRQRRLPLVGHDDEFQKVLQILQQTINAGEGNSMLLIGARGSGKTTLVENAILQAQFSDARDRREDFYVVRLNGFIHTDDKLALKEIWRQLGEQMQVDDETMAGKNNYADTLTSLLALLSHPAEHSGETADEGQTSKSVIFVLDEFDLFTSHPRQTLLYNLFDIAQSRKAPIAVLGLTTKIQVVESLEKRVKSRFSHRYVHLSLPKTFDAFQDICKSTLLCESSEFDAGSVETLEETELMDSLMFRELHAVWSSYMTSILTGDPTFSHMLRRIYAHTKSVPEFMSACLLPIVSMTPQNIPTAADFTSHTLFPPDSKLHILPGLSEIELALLIAAARLDIILDTDTCNFNMAYDEYTSLASRAKMLSSASGAAAVSGGARVWGRDVALGAWESLEALELLVPAFGAGGGGAMAEVGRSGKLWKVDVGLEEIGASRLEMGSVMARWCREI
ncbi:hypothetical protein MMC11_002015 [Xylographa trunciseda]|nr:hypothetical protein [Xylographa trunciseda]